VKRAWLLALMVSVATPAVAQQYQYVARTEAPAARQGAVTAGPLTWQCQGSACTIGGPWPAPGVPACAALAREVGRITAYGRQGAMLNAQQLATCNAGIAAVAPTLRLPPRVIAGGPLIVVRPQPQSPQQPQPQPQAQEQPQSPPQSQPQAQEQPQPAPESQSQAEEQPQPAPPPPPQEQPQPAPSGPVAVTTPELSFIVNPEATERPADVSVDVATPELSFVVNAEAAPTAPPEIVSVTTPELSFVVQ
jgi:hypothetical protein